MELKEKIEYIKSNFKNNHPNRVVEFYTSSETNHEKVYETTLPDISTEIILQLFLDELEKYGECAGTDPKGHWVKVVDFELINR